jgi:hypothetical protein
MIKFFRKIRQKLLTENKFSKYLIYAIGEIVLVVIGILIALSINNWNEEKKSKIKSREYCEKLVSDLVTDTINIYYLINNCEQIQGSIEMYFDFFEQGNNTLSDLIDSSKSIQWKFFRYLPVNYTFVDMQSSGNTDLLNEEQRRSLIELSNAQKFLQIVIDKAITDTKNEMYERNKYLDFDQSESDFFERISTQQDRSSKVQGLKHQHNVLTSIHNLCGFMKSLSEPIKEHSKRCLELLQENEITE